MTLIHFLLVLVTPAVPSVSQFARIHINTYKICSVMHNYAYKSFVLPQQQS